jgi:signal transduction histidine kinase
MPMTAKPQVDRRPNFSNFRVIMLKDPVNGEIEPDGKSAAEPTSAVAGQDDVAHVFEELKRRTAELEEANREQIRVSHYRSLFLGRMSHELRTPLTSILGFTEILLDQEQLTETQSRFCQKIRDSGLQLQASLDQLVDLSRLEAGRTEIFLQEFALLETMRDSCAAVARLAQRRRVTVDYALAPDLAPNKVTVVSDKGRLRQILYTFLGWCVSRSSSGQTVSLKADLVQPARLYLCLEDEGKRIEDPAKVFDPDDRVASSELPNLDELGVIIGRRLVNLLGGTVAVENREPDGVRVLIELPARPAREQ